MSSKHATYSRKKCRASVGGGNQKGWEVIYIFPFVGSGANASFVSRQQSYTHSTHGAKQKA